MLKPLIALPLLALVLAGCAPTADPAADGSLTIVASTNVYGDIAQTIGGDAVEVTSIIDDPSADPHQFEASGRVQLALSKADIVIVNGGGYDDFATQMLEASGNDAATVIDAVEVSNFDTAAEGFNEHVWYSYETVEAVAQDIADALVAEDPGNAGAYDANLATFTDGITQLRDRVFDLRTNGAEGVGVIITEPVPGYLLDGLGLRNLTPPEFSEAIEEDADVPPTLLQEVLNLLGDGSAQLVIYNAQTGGPQTDAILDIASEQRIPAIGVTETLPDGLHYVAWQAGYLDVIENALSD